MNLASDFAVLGAPRKRGYRRGHLAAAAQAPRRRLIRNPRLRGQPGADMMAAGDEDAEALQEETLRPYKEDPAPTSPTRCGAERWTRLDPDFDPPPI